MERDGSWLTKEVINHNRIRTPATISRVNNVQKEVEELSNESDKGIEGRKEKQICEKPVKEDHFPGDNLEQESVAKQLFCLADFYPKPNIVEAYLRSRNGHGKRNSIETLRLWSNIMESVQGRRESLELSQKEIDKTDAVTVEINTLTE